MHILRRGAYNDAMSTMLNKITFFYHLYILSTFISFPRDWDISNIWKRPAPPDIFSPFFQQNSTSLVSNLFLTFYSDVKSTTLTMKMKDSVIDRIAVLGFVHNISGAK